MGSSETQERQALHKVSAAGLMLIGIFVVIFAISQPFEYDSNLTPPTLWVVGLLLLGVCTAFWGLGAALRSSRTRELLILIVAIGISLRLVALFTCPILEIDYYRYLWDGKVLAHSVSPYKFSPAQVVNEAAKPDFHYENKSTTNLRQIHENSELQKLVAISVESESNNAILNRIHFGEYSTIYPPVSQAVFGLAMKWFPSTASVGAHVVFMKAVLIVFDLMILTLVLLVLRQQRLHVGWLIVYAWNPLVIKEIANGGHLDSIAVFLLVLSVFFLSRWMVLQNEKQTWTLPGLSGVALGLGFGAKLFPIILFPALLITVARVQWSKAILFGAVFTATAGLSVFPMYHSLKALSNNLDRSVERTPKFEMTQIEDHAGNHLIAEVMPLSHTNPPGNSTLIKKEGLTSFLSKWRMNDVVFSSIYLNLKPPSNENADSPWFVFTSKEWRQSIKQNCASRSLGGANPAFAITRVLTLGLFSIFYLWQLIAIYHRRVEPGEPNSNQSPVSIEFERLVWILVAFLFLQPTVNPWYWLWIAPLTVFSRNRGWLFAGGLLLIYYSRFWFELLPNSYAISGYSGVGMFDHGLAWIEFGAIVAVIFLFKAHRKSG